MRKKVFGISALLLELALGACTFTVGGGNSSSPAESDGSDSSGSSDSTGPGGEPGETIITEEEADVFLAEVPSAEEAIETFGGSIVSGTIHAQIVESSTDYQPAYQVYEGDTNDPDDLYMYALTNYSNYGGPAHHLRVKGKEGYEGYTVPAGTSDVYKEQYTDEEMSSLCASFIGQMRTFYHELYQEAYFSFDDCDEVVYSKVGDDLLRRKGTFTGLTYSYDHSKTYDGTLEILINKYGYMLEFKVDAVGTDGTETIPMAYDYNMSYNPEIERKTIQDLVPGYTGDEPAGEVTITKEEADAYLAGLPTAEEALEYFNANVKSIEATTGIADSSTGYEPTFVLQQIDVSDPDDIYVYEEYPFDGVTTYSLLVKSGDGYDNYSFVEGTSDVTVTPMTAESVQSNAQRVLQHYSPYYYGNIVSSYFSFESCTDAVYSKSGNLLRMSGSFEGATYRSMPWDGTLEMAINEYGYIVEYKAEAIGSGSDNAGTPLLYDLTAYYNAAIQRITIQDLVPGYTGEATGESAISEEEGRAYLEGTLSVEEAQAYFDEEIKTVEFWNYGTNSVLEGEKMLVGRQIDLRDEDDIYFFLRDTGPEGLETNLYLKEGEAYVKHAITAGGDYYAEEAAVEDFQPLLDNLVNEAKQAYFHYELLEDTFFSFDDVGGTEYYLVGDNLLRKTQFEGFGQSSIAFDGSMEMLIDRNGLVLEYRLVAEGAGSSGVITSMDYDMTFSFNGHNYEFVRMSPDEMVSRFGA